MADKKRLSHTEQCLAQHEAGNLDCICGAFNEQRVADDVARQKFEILSPAERYAHSCPANRRRVIIEAFEAGMREGETAKWISVEENLPEIGKEVLAGAFIRCDFTDGRKTVNWQHCLQIWTGDRWIDADSGEEDGATHWQPLPSPPTIVPLSSEEISDAAKS